MNFAQLKLIISIKNNFYFKRRHITPTFTSLPSSQKSRGEREREREREREKWKKLTLS
jgi:hypothetical protein